MSDLTEVEIFDCLVSNFRMAAEDCDALAARPVSGPAYIRLRDELALIEGACRQAAAWRMDDRWLDIAAKMPTAHRLAGEWLRGVQQPDGSRRPIPAGQLHPMFLELAKFLRWAATVADECRHAKTGRTGDNLRPLPASERTAGRSGWRKTTGGLLVPDGAAA